MALDLTAEILTMLDMVLSMQGFRRREAEHVLACWVRRTWHTNRAVVVIECPSDADPALFAREYKAMCRKAAGFFVPVFYGWGLQIVVLGPPARTDPVQVVDTFDNQICVLQSVHIVDLKGRVTRSAATWGQFLTGEIQAAIASALQTAVISDDLADPPPEALESVQGNAAGVSAERANAHAPRDQGDRSPLKIAEPPFIFRPEGSDFLIRWDIILLLLFFLAVLLLFFLGKAVRVGLLG